MDNRKRLVLKTIVDHYIKTGQPVSSQTLLEDYGLTVSSATIRNDMKYLEQKGLIQKAYSSAGRVPTELGYRFFVDWLVELSELNRRDQHAIIESYRFQRQEIEELLRQTAFLLANMSGYAGFVLSPRLEETQLESIVFVKLDVENVLVVIVSELGIIEHCMIRSPLSPEELQEIGTLLNGRLRGHRLDEVRDEALRFAEGDGWYDSTLRNAFVLLKETLERRLQRRLHVEGVFNLLPRLLGEGLLLEDALEVFTLLGDADRSSLYLESLSSPQVKVNIGSENEASELHPCSLVLMGYGFSGVLGLLGPVRMDYSKAFSITSYIGNRLRTILTLSHRANILTLTREASGQ
ncbi:MAG: heat-inducible transcription repressor HrcA [Candidatus Fraserbacteria bacterium RBG_16_55_9]|uniref:Heat-inducible transcription repressor HrcA n=1 Tax=Fraserbacteria sp. (strain RBG_16_55_9) TaxID=1817864 RepID=A0A1F5V1F0_FRAXR|nr:MAG: heat-inducible transcription repressor HrcA [Candidatus Fraserbacteria bacterium RBG_16_55_9]